MKTHSPESRDVKQTVEHHFSQVAANYRTSQVHAAGVDLEQMVLAARLSGREVVLDAGCGAGHTALAFAPHVARVIAYDLSAPMLEQVAEMAEERGLANVEIQRGDVENLPFEDGMFDIVTTRYSAHHWPNPQRALSQFRRVLKQGPTSRGQLLLSDVVSSDDFALDTFIQSIELLRDISHVRDHTPTQWMAMLSGAGFTAELVYQWDLRLDFSSWVERMATPADAVAVICALFDRAPEDVRSALRLEADYSFTFRGALLRGVGQ